MKSKILPEKTVERLSEYRRTLLQLQDLGKTHIYSHEIASLHHITAVQVRRDIMFIGYTSPKRKGYDIQELINVIGKIVDAEKKLNVAVVGMGNYGRAITAYFKGKRPKLEIVAAFDASEKKIGKNIAGISCYDITDLETIIEQKSIKIAIITVPPEVATEVKDKLIEAGVKGILNFTSEILNVPCDVFLEEYDMITSLEKVAYFTKAKEIYGCTDE